MFAPNNVSRVHTGLIRVDVDKFQRSHSFQHKKFEKAQAEINGHRSDHKKTIRRASTLHVNGHDKKANEKFTVNGDKIHDRISSEPIDIKKTGPRFERTLLKKKTEDLTGSKSETFVDDSSNGEKQVRSASLDRKFWKKNRKDELKNLTKRHHSFSHQKKRHSHFSRAEDVGYESANEIKRNSSPNEIKRISSFTYKPNNRSIIDRGYQSASPQIKHKIVRDSPQTDDSPVNSTYDDNITSNRRMSLRRSKSIDLSNEDISEMKNEEPTRKMSRFRRRRSSDNTRHKYVKQSCKQTVIKNSTQESRHARLVRLYSGGADDVKSRALYDAPSEYEDYSSAASDIDFRQDKRKPGLVLKVWRSINSLFQANDERPTRSNILMTGTPPLLRRISPDKRLSQSLPEGLHNEQFFTKQNLYSSKKPYSPLIYDVKFPVENDEPKTNTRSKKQRYKRSKSAEYLSGLIRNSSFSRKTSNQYSRKQSLPAKIGNKVFNSRESKYSIIISQRPGSTSSEAEKDAILNNNNNTLDGAYHQIKRLSNVERVSELKSTLNNELEMFLKDKTFDAVQVNTWCRTLSERIKDKVTLITEDNFKVVAQVFIGALLDNGIHAAVQSDCTQPEDVFLTASFRCNGMYAMASLLTYKLDLD